MREGWNCTHVHWSKLFGENGGDSSGGGGLGGGGGGGSGGERGWSSSTSGAMPVKAVTAALGEGLGGGGLGGGDVVSTTVRDCSPPETPESRRPLDMYPPLSGLTRETGRATPQRVDWVPNPHLLDTDPAPPSLQAVSTFDVPSLFIRRASDANLSSPWYTTPDRSNQHESRHIPSEFST